MGGGGLRRSWGTSECALIQNRTRGGRRQSARPRRRRAKSCKPAPQSCRLEVTHFFKVGGVQKLLEESKVFCWGFGGRKHLIKTCHTGLGFYSILFQTCGVLFEAIHRNEVLRRFWIFFLGGGQIRLASRPFGSTATHDTLGNFKTYLASVGDIFSIQMKTLIDGFDQDFHQSVLRLFGLLKGRCNRPRD